MRLAWYAGVRAGIESYRAKPRPYSSSSSFTALQSQHTDALPQVSTALAATVVVSAFHQRANFYSAMVYLAQSNFCLLVSPLEQMR